MTLYEAFIDELQKEGIVGDILNMMALGSPGVVQEALARGEKIQSKGEAEKRLKGRGGIGGSLKYLFTPGYRQSRRGEREKAKEYLKSKKGKK